MVENNERIIECLALNVILHIISLYFYILGIVLLYLRRIPIGVALTLIGYIIKPKLMVCRMIFCLEGSCLFRMKYLFVGVILLFNLTGYILLIVTFPDKSPEINIFVMVYVYIFQ